MKTMDMGDVIGDPQNVIIYVTAYIFHYRLELHMGIVFTSERRKVNGEHKKAAQTAGVLFCSLLCSIKQWFCSSCIYGVCVCD